MTLPQLPEPAHEQVEEYSGIAMNKVVVTPLFSTAQMLAYGAACAAAERGRIINLLPGGDYVDPQWLADAIRAQETP